MEGKGPLGIIFGLLLFGAGLFQVGSVLVPGMQSNHWLPTTGVITDSQVTGFRDHKGGNHHAEVSYRYVVGGNTYTGNRISYLFRTYQVISLNPSKPDYYENDAREIVKKYPVGQRVTVYYDPAHEDRAVLQRGIPPETWTGLPAFNIAIVALGFVACILKLIPGGDRDYDG